MLNSKSLRQALKKIFKIDDKYLVPLDQGWYVPTYDKEDKVGTWIGYRVMSKVPNVRTFTGRNERGPTKIKSIKVSFRLSFIGPQAEDLAEMLLLWDDRADVQEAFEECSAQINYNKRQQFSYPVKAGGLNDNLCWVTDFEAHSFYEVDAGYKPWNLKGVKLGGDIIIPNKEV